jgi:hypothetical protein
MRLELLDERTRSFVLALLGDPRTDREPKRSHQGRTKRAGASLSGRHDGVHLFAEELINNQCGSHSLALIYRFLLTTYGTPAKARAEFERYLSGEWSSEWIQAAREAVREQEECAAR